MLKILKNLNNGSGHSKKKRRVKNKQFMAGVSGVVLFEEEPRTSQIQKKAKEFCKWKGKEFPGAQPVSMDLQNMGYLHDKPYRVSWKADGVRYSTLKYYLLALPAVPSAWLFCLRSSEFFTYVLQTLFVWIYLLTEFQSNLFSSWIHTYTCVLFYYVLHEGYLKVANWTC